ncbi:prolyl oligopeptidase family serine peptidase [Steroidobacter agaridevorans]|uniref:prolyl oligopeptidase family serine peptidase n=1 Tax=Steroidobacter agaridevorans TaxID=2695856 RepID=UPI0013232491|nr:prolyl oligopeptidase family serine peptidase [Steroidobacter agaridevorans]GFE88707.1 prolyl endopeptidase [Steroidobacter agaridevorans]
MQRKIQLLLPALLLLGACGVEPAKQASDDPAPLTASTSATPTAMNPAFKYPATRRIDHIDTYHGTQVADPYRWLEQAESVDTQSWIQAQNALAQPYLESIPARERIKQRMTQLWNYERYDVPLKRGKRYFYLRNDGLQNQSVLYMTERLDAQPRVLLDPNQLSKDATVALGEFVPSPDGRIVAYSLSDGGTDWRTWHFRDVETGKDLPDVLRFIKFVPVAWTADSKSVYYARFPLKADGQGDDSKQREVFWHKLGADVAKDPLIFKVTDHPTRNPYVQISDDGRYVIFWLYDGSQSTGIYYRKLGRDGAPVGETVRLIDSFDANYQFIAEIDDVFYIRSNSGAPNAQVVAMPVNGKKETRVVVPAGPFSADEVSIVGRRIIVRYLQDAYSLVRVFDLDGKVQYDVKLPGLGTAQGFEGGVDDNETFFAYADFLTPMSISRLDLATGETQVFRAPKLAADTSQFVVKQVFYKSKDGTKVPMFIAHKKDLALTGQNFVQLYGYGGFNIAQQPSFSVPVLVWLEMGGVYAVANLRGGSEYGEAWHEAGTRLQKQNVFDDFIAAAEYLVAEKYTSPAKIAIRGRSNGGLLVGAALTQRPDLFGAALPAVGVLDMLRYHTPSANARQWSSDYGLSENEAEFRAQLAYSPLHNVHKVCYPPTLVTTADRDDRVVPWHSYKFAATLQEAQSCANPVMLRVETRAGHGAGKPVWMQIEDYADQWAFLVKSLHMEDAGLLSQRTGAGAN